MEKRITCYDVNDLFMRSSSAGLLAVSLTHRVSECKNKASSASNSRVSTAAVEACYIKRYKLYEIHTVKRRRSIHRCLINWLPVLSLPVTLLHNYMRSWRGGGDAALLRIGYSLQMT